MKQQQVYLKISPDGSVANSAWFLGWFKEAIAKHHGKDIRLTIERKRKNRSSNQNRFFHGVFLESFAEMHNFFGTFDFEIDIEFAKEVMKQESYWPKRDGIPVPSSHLDTVAMEKVMEDARVKYAEHWQLPYPHQERFNDVISQ